MKVRVTLCCGLQHEFKCDLLKYYQTLSTNAVQQVEILDMSNYEKCRLEEDRV